MELTEAQYERIAPLLPVQRGNVRVSNLQVLNAILYVAGHGGTAGTTAAGGAVALWRYPTRRRGLQ